MKRLFALLTACVMLLGVTACQSEIAKQVEENTETSGEKTTETEATAGTASSGDATEPTEPEEPEVSASPLNLSADKLSTSVNMSEIKTCPGGIYYKDDSGKYGIINYNGTLDTGAVYYSCESEGDFFVVSKTRFDENKGVKGYNYLGLVNNSGKELLPAKYAAIEKLSERYYQFIEITGETDDKSKAIMYITDRIGGVGPADGDTLVTGIWRIYDVENGRIVPGIEGTSNPDIDIYGEVIAYRNDAKQYCYADDNGTSLEKRNYFGNGAYVEDGTLYTSYGSPILKFGDRDYRPYSCTDDGKYYCASRTVDGEKRSVLMDEKGGHVTAEFKGGITVYGSVILNEGKLCDFQGNVILDESVKHVYETAVSDDVYFAMADEAYILIDIYGNVYYRGDDTLDYIDTTSFAVREKSTELYYCYKDGDYTFDGIERFTWSVKVENSDGYYDLVSVADGKVLISDSNDLKQAVTSDGTVYIYAKTRTGTWDVYTLKAE